MPIVNEQTLKIAGKIGNKVYYNVRGEQRVRAYAIPVQPGTPAQLANWDKFKFAVAFWQLLPGIVKEQFNRRAKRLQMSGFNLHMREMMLT